MEPCICMSYIATESLAALLATNTYHCDTDWLWGNTIIWTISSSLKCVATDIHAVVKPFLKNPV